MRPSRNFALILIGALMACTTSGAADAPAPHGNPRSSHSGDVELKAFATIDDPIISQLEFALDYAGTAFKTAPSTRMEILVGGKATVLVLDASSPVRERLRAATVDPRLRIYACSEDTQRLKQRLGADRARLVPGTLEASCEEKARQFLEEDWIRIDVKERGQTASSGE